MQWEITLIRADMQWEATLIKPTCHERPPLLDTDLLREITLIRGRPAMGDHPH